MQRDKNQKHLRKLWSSRSEINLYHFIDHSSICLWMVKLCEDVHDLFSCTHLFFNELQIIHCLSILLRSSFNILALNPLAKHLIFLESFKSIENVCFLVQKSIYLVRILSLKGSWTVDAHKNLLIYYSISK